MSGGRVIPIGAELPALGEPTDTGKRSAAAKPKHSTNRRGNAVRRRFGHLNAFVDYALPKLKRSDIAAWLLLYRHAKPDGRVSASVADLARRTGCSERAMRYALERLQAGGLLERLKRGTLAGGPSVWRLLWPQPP